jgi:hypothetical protein
MKILAIDPGNKVSGWVVFNGERVTGARIVDNEEALDAITYAGHSIADILAIEMMRARGMLASNDAFETLVWVGRFMQAWPHPKEVVLAYRQDVKLHLTGSPKATDANVNTVLRDIVGPVGTKKNQGPTFGVTSHAWAALAVAVFVRDQLQGKLDAFTRTVDGRPALRGRTRVRI